MQFSSSEVVGSISFSWDARTSSVTGALSPRFPETATKFVTEKCLTWKKGNLCKIVSSRPTFLFCGVCWKDSACLAYGCLPLPTVTTQCVATILAGYRNFFYHLQPLQYLSQQIPTCQHLHVLQLERHTIVSVKKAFFICEIAMERYIYLFITQTQLKATNDVRNKSFLEFNVVYDGVCLKFLGSLLQMLKILHICVIW